MDADLTCPACEGSGQRFEPVESQSLRGPSVRRAPCPDCRSNPGRRPPTLAEWDALRADRETLAATLAHYRGTLRGIAFGLTNRPDWAARAVLDHFDELGE